MGKGNGTTRASSSNNPKGISNNPFAPQFKANNIYEGEIIENRMWDEIDSFKDENPEWKGANGFIRQPLNGRIVNSVWVMVDHDSWSQSEDGLVEYYFRVEPQVAFGTRTTASERADFNALRVESLAKRFRNVKEASTWILNKAKSLNKQI